MAGSRCPAKGFSRVGRPHRRRRNRRDHRGCPRRLSQLPRPAGAGPELEKRFAHRAHAVENSPGFLGFQLLRPVKGEERYFVVTHWESDEAFQAWANGPAIAAHAGHRANPVATGASLLEFEVVLDVGGTGKTA